MEELVLFLKVAAFFTVFNWWMTRPAKQEDA